MIRTLPDKRGMARIALACIVVVAACDGDAGTADTTAAVDSSVAAPPVDSASPSTGSSLVIDSGGIGKVRIGRTLDEARKALPDAAFKRTSDGDGVALVEVSLGPDTALVAYAGEDDADAHIDWTKRVERIEVFDNAFHTADGIRPGMLVTDVEKLLGAVREIMLSAIESREYVSFEKQPVWLTFRLDYTGVFAQGSRTTTKYERGAKIQSIAVARH